MVNEQSIHLMIWLHRLCSLNPEGECPYALLTLQILKRDLDKSDTPCIKATGGLNNRWYNLSREYRKRSVSNIYSRSCTLNSGFSLCIV